MDDDVKSLHKAIENRNEQLIQTLIQNSVNLKARNDRGMNSLHLAVERSSSEIVDLLLNADKSLVDEVVVSERESDVVGYTALHFSAKIPDWFIARLLLRNGAKCDVVDRNLRTPLHVASLYGNTEFVEELLCYRAPVNTEDCEGKTAFMYAVERDHVDVVKVMLQWTDKTNLESYAKVIIEMASNSRFLEFLHLLFANDFFYPVFYENILIDALKCAFEKRGTNVIDNLLSSMNISLDNTRTIATVDSVNEKNIKVAQFFMNSYDYIIKFVDLEAALHLALVNNCNDILSTYLQEGENVDSKDSYGYSLLYKACFMNNLDAAKKCIALGCDVNATNSSGDTALHAAVYTLNPELVVLLKESGCDLNARNDKLETPFQLFLMNQYYLYNRNRNLSSDVIEFKQMNVMEFAEMLFKPGMDLNCHENSRECVLHLAVITGIVELVKLVIKCHPSLDHLDKESGQTCLHVAAKRNYVDIVKFLLELGANPDVWNRRGELPITIAINEGHEEIVKLLVNYSNLNAYRSTHRNETVMHLGAMANNEAIISALVSAGVDLQAKNECQKTAMCYASKGHCGYEDEYVIDESVCQHLLNVGFDVNVGYHDWLQDCRCWYGFYTQEFAKIHVLKLHLVKCDLQPFLKPLIDNAEMEFKNVYDDISEEAKRFMTSRIPDTNIPFTDIIKLDDKKLANYARNESVVQVFKDVDSLKMKWPHYWQILYARMTKGFVRRRLLEKCYVIFNRVDGPVMRPECVELLFDNLKTSELHTFILSFPSVDTSEFDDLWFIP